MANNLDAFSPEYRSARTQRLLKRKLIAREIANMEEQAILRDGDIISEDTIDKLGNELDSVICFMSCASISHLIDSFKEYVKSLDQE